MQFSSFDPNCSETKKIFRTLMLSVSTHIVLVLFKSSTNLGSVPTKCCRTPSISCPFCCHERLSPNIHTDEMFCCKSINFRMEKYFPLWTSRFGIGWIISLCHSFRVSWLCKMWSRRKSTFQLNGIPKQLCWKICFSFIAG